MHVCVFLLRGGRGANLPRPIRISFQDVDDEVKQEDLEEKHELERLKEVILLRVIFSNLSANNGTTLDGE